MRDLQTALVEVPGAVLEVSEAGAGDPVLLVQTALNADELAPVASRLAEGFRTISVHRRGYGASTPATGDGSIARDVADCRHLLEALGVRRAHVVGLSFSAAVALDLAASAPEVVHSLTLVEPPPVSVPSAPEFRATCAALIATRRTAGAEAALEEFMGLLVGPTWEAESERLLPGSVAQMRRDAGTFFDVDLPALLVWQPPAPEAVTSPVLHVGGTDSGPWFAEVRRQVLGWFPEAEDVRIDGADHSLALTHPDAVAAAVRGFLRRHPLG